MSVAESTRPVPVNRAAGETLPQALAVETLALRKRFGSVRVLDSVDLRVPEGAITAILGPSGTGKTVLLKHLLGLLKPDKGEVLVSGRALSRMSRSEVIAMRREIGVMFQDGALFSSMSVYDNVAFPLRQHTDYAESEVRELVLGQLQSVGLLRAARRYPSEVSGGMRKRVGLARALVLDPKVLLADEPDSGLDPVRTARLGQLLLERQGDTGGALLVVTHDTMLASRIADQIVLLWRGRIRASGPAADVLESDDPFVRQFLSGATSGPLRMD